MYILNKQKQSLDFFTTWGLFCKVNFTYNYFMQISEELVEKIGISSQQQTTTFGALVKFW